MAVTDRFESSDRAYALRVLDVQPGGIVVLTYPASAQSPFLSDTFRQLQSQLTAQGAYLLAIPREGWDIDSLELSALMSMHRQIERAIEAINKVREHGEQATDSGSTPDPTGPTEPSGGS